MPVLRLAHASGGSAEIYLHGAQVMSWMLPGGEEKLFVASEASFVPGQPIRGGIPVVFPQFAHDGPLPQHGFARTALWTLLGDEDDERHASATLELSESEATNALWPHRFQAHLTVSVGASELEVTLGVTNTDSHSFNFTTALHTYLAIGDIREAALEGLTGGEYLDKTRENTRLVEESERLVVMEHTDSVYVDAPNSLILRDGGRRPPTRIDKTGFRDVVVWNPWSEKVTTFSGMTAEDYLHTICVEAAQVIVPIELGPGESWQGSQKLSVQGGTGLGAPGRATEGKGAT